MNDKFRFLLGMRLQYISTGQGKDFSYSGCRCSFLLFVIDTRLTLDCN
jgi:hypothetical protein